MQEGGVQAVIDRLIAALDAHPGMHVYHFAPYEPTAFKKLMGRHATRGPELDRLLRAERFVDLYGVIRHAIRAGIESYSIKELEQFYGFTRTVTLKEAGRCRGIVEGALDRRSPHLVKDAEFDVVREYETTASRPGIARLVGKASAGSDARGDDVPRPPNKPGEPSEEVGERDQEVLALRARLLMASRPDGSTGVVGACSLSVGLPARLASSRGQGGVVGLPALQADEAGVIDEPLAVAGWSSSVKSVEKPGFIHRFSYPLELNQARQTLKTQDGKVFAEVAARPPRPDIDLLVGPSRRAGRPTALFEHDHVNARVIEDALLDLARMTADAGGVERLPDRPEGALLLRARPALNGRLFAPPSRSGNASATDYAVEIVTKLDRTTLAIQGPPGSGKTYTGARMILAAIDAGLKVVTGPITKSSGILDAGGGEPGSRSRRQEFRTAASAPDRRKAGSGDDVEPDSSSGIVNLPAIRGASRWGRTVNAASTAGCGQAGFTPTWMCCLWTGRQMALANTLAIARAASSLVLLGDPQQLEQPSKGSHPDGIGGSALEYVLGGARTIPEEAGLFLPVTWRLAPSICAFTSEVFYAGALMSKPGLERQQLSGNGEFEGSGLWMVPLAHASAERGPDESR
jgi:uncharacterized protein